MSARVVITEENNRVIVDDDVVRVISVGVAGPPGPPGETGATGPAPWFVATDYGGSWDGVGDDSAAIQAALDDNVAAGGGGQVWLPLGGLGRIETIVTIDAPVTIVGNQTTLQIVADAAFRAGASNVTLDGLHIDAADATFRNLLERWDGTGDYTGWVIRDCVLDNVALRFERFGRMGADGIVKDTGTGIVAHSRIERCEIRNFAQNYALALGGIDEVTVDGCYIHDCGIDVNAGDGIKVLDGSINVKIVNSTVEDVTRDCIDAYDSSRVTISGNVLNRAGAMALDAKWQTTDPNETLLNIISDNRSDGCANGYNISVSNALVQGNVCENATGYGFRASHAVDDSGSPSVGISFVGNLAANCGADGFLLSAGDGFMIVGNQAYGNTGRGIAISSTAVTNSRFLGNIAVDNVAGGIQVAGATNQYIGNSGPGLTDNEIRIPNNVRLRLLESGGTARDVLYMSTGNSFTLGNNNNSMNLVASTVFGFGTMDLQGTLRHRGASLSFYNATPIAKQTVSGSRTDGTALESLLTALATIGLITDSSTG